MIPIGHLINQTTLDQVKLGAYFVNHARGALIDESAMLNALHKSIVAGYATDTMEKNQYVRIIIF